MLHIVLVEPEIPQNTGNIVRTAAATGSILHLVKPLGFEISDKYLKRAGLDYWDKASIQIHESFEEFLSSVKDKNLHFFSSHAKKSHAEISYQDGDYLVFGKESVGLPNEYAQKENAIRIPMRDGIRCLNLSNAVAIVVYEALRQMGYPGLK